METHDYDPRVTRLPMMDSPVRTIIICLAYLVFVKVLGPAWMRHRKPYSLRGLLIAHNFVLVMASAYMFHKFGKHGWYSRYSWTCANVDYLETEDSLQIVYISWLFYLSKFLELGDTVFFIFRKKDSQVTFLHVVHHFVVPMTTWYAISLGAGGYNVLFGFLNSFVHIWMYSYYGLAALGPSIQKYLWWKKYLTKLQILQFGLMTLAMISVMVTPGCKVSAKMVAVSLGHAVFFLILFTHFYLSAYKAQKKRKSIENGADRKLFIHPDDLDNDTGSKKLF